VSIILYYLPDVVVIFLTKYVILIVNTQEKTKPTQYAICITRDRTTLGTDVHASNIVDRSTHKVITNPKIKAITLHLR